MKLKRTLSQSMFLFSIVFFLCIPLRIIQIICLTYVFIYIISFFYSFILKRGILIERRITKLKIACKEKVDVTIIFKNKSKLKADIFYIFDSAPFLLVEKNKNCQIVTIRPNEVLNYTYTVSSLERGIYEIGPILIRTSDPFGFFPFQLEIKETLQIVVRPARINLITNAHPGLPQGSLKINNAVYEDITQRKSVRPYMYGDEKRRINWRISAKENDLYINLYENTYNTTFFVFLNLAQDDYSINQRYYETEKAIEIAASIVEKARKLHQRIGFAAYGTGFPYIPPALNQYEIILDILAVIKTEEGKLEYNPVSYYKNQLSNETVYYIVGPEQVRNYFLKVEANNEDITTDNIFAYRTK